MTGVNKDLLMVSRKVLKKLRVSKFFNTHAKIKIGTGDFIIPLDGDENELLLHLKEGFKKTAIDLLSNHVNTRIFVDIGANIGQTMLEVNSRDQSIIYFWFEPNPRAFKVLQEIAELNSIQATLFPWACSAQASPIQLFTVGSTDVCATIVPETRPDTYEKVSGKWIASYPFDSIAPSLNLKNNFIMKIDVEGAELEVLKGAAFSIKSFRPAILCEVLHAHRSSEIEDNNRNKAYLEEFLSSLDYALYACRLHPQHQEALLGIEKIEAFPRDVVWKNSPNTCDYIFLPRELNFCTHLIQTCAD